METEEEKNPETNADTDENPTEESVNLDQEDEELTELLRLE